MSDPYGNPIAFGALTNPTIAISAASGAGFDSGSSSLITTITCLNSGVSCATGAVAFNYYQSYTYGAVGSLTAIITGNYPTASSPVVSVSSASGNFITATQASTLTVAVTSSANPAFSAGSTVKLTATLTGTTQPGVPVTFNLCGQQAARTVCLSTTIGYGGSFVGAGQTGFSASSGTTGTATATYTLDPTLTNVGTWNATVPAPVNGAPKTILASGASNTVTTVAGAASSFKILAYFTDQTDLIKSSLVAGQTSYVVVELVDNFGNVVPNNAATQIQIQLSTSTGTLSATTVYIAVNDVATNGANSFGPIQWIIPSSTAVGTVVNLAASGVVNGVAVSPTKAVTIVTPLPSLSVTAPAPVSGTIYSSSAGITFKGWANVSAGYVPTTTIASINYKLGTGHWLQAAGAGPNKDPYAFSIFVPTGLSTIMFNATDSLKNTVVSSSYNLLVDTAPPTITFATPATTNTGCTTVTVTTTEGDFNPATFTATYGGNAVPSGAISWTGTQTPGSASSQTGTICGLVSGTALLSVTGSTMAGLSTTVSESLTVTVAFANSITFNTATATYGIVGAYKGVTVSVTNNWNTAQTVVIFATLKSGTSIYVAEGTATIASGTTNAVVCLDLQTVPAGSYSVTFAAVTTSNQAVSGPVTAITLVAT